MPKKSIESDFDCVNSRGEVRVCDIDTDTAVEFCDALWERFNENNQAPIIIRINSNGGDVDAMLSMMDTMDSIRAVAPEGFAFVTIAEGKAVSAGCDLLAHGDIRLAKSSTRIMAHQSSWWAAGVNDSALAGALDSDRQNTQALQIFAKNIGYKGGPKKLKNRLIHDSYFTAQQAKDFGIIDEIADARPKTITKHMIEIIPEKANKQRRVK